MTDPGCWAVPGHDREACVNTQPGGYCAPKRCYCGGCPWYVPIDVMPTYTPDAYTQFDQHAVARGQRVSGARRRAARDVAGSAPKRAPGGPGSPAAAAPPRPGAGQGV